MRLTVLTPTGVALDVDDVRRVRAADATGELGVHPGHEDLLTLLEVGVLVYTTGAGATRYVAVDGGVLGVTGGDRVEVLAPEAVAGDDLRALEDTIVRGFRARLHAERAASAGLARLQAALASRLEVFLRPTRATPSMADARPAPRVGP